MKDYLVDGRYRIDYKIGHGGFGVVYAGTDIKLGSEVAIKLVPDRDGPGSLQTEAAAYKELGRGVGIPQTHWFGEEYYYYILVQESLGPSLEDLLAYCGRRFSVKTVLLLADQAVARLQHIHTNGLLHRDITPGNFLMGAGTQGNVLYAIDFGLAKEYGDATRHYPRGGRPFGGTAMYASLNNHDGNEQSCGDDLESLGYVLLYLARGSLPWETVHAATAEDEAKLIGQLKRSTSPEALFEGLPGELATYMAYARSLPFDQRPNYAYLRGLFRRAFLRRGFKYDNVFDWTEKRFGEVQAELDARDAVDGE